MMSSAYEVKRNNPYCTFKEVPYHTSHSVEALLPLRFALYNIGEILARRLHLRYNTSAVEPIKQRTCIALWSRCRKQITALREFITMGRRKVFASCDTRSTGRVLHASLQPISSLLVSVAVCLVGLVACLDLVHGSHHHHSRGARFEPSDRLCSFTPKEEQEYVAARYESVRPDSGDDLQDFLREWRRDVREEETVRFQPIKMVCSPALQIFPAVPALIRRHIQCIVCFFMHCAYIIIY